MAVENFGTEASLSRELISILKASGHSRRTIAAWQTDAAQMFCRSGQTWHELHLLSQILDDYAFGSFTDHRDFVVREYVAELAGGHSLTAMARRCYLVALALAPGHPQTVYNLGALDMMEDDADAAYAGWQSVIKNEPRNKQIIYNAWWNCGEIDERRGRQQEAADEYSRAIAWIGGIGPHQRKYSRLLQALNLPERAAEQYDAVMIYSHRYAPEFINVAGSKGLMPPRNSEVHPADPFCPVKVGLSSDRHDVIYFAGAYFRWPNDTPVPQGAREFLDQASRIPVARRRFAIFNRVTAVCAPSADYWNN